MFSKICPICHLLTLCLSNSKKIKINSKASLEQKVAGIWIVIITNFLLILDDNKLL